MPEPAKQFSAKQLLVDKWQLLLEKIAPPPLVHELEHHLTQFVATTVEFSKLGFRNNSILGASWSTTDTESR